MASAVWFEPKFTKRVAGSTLFFKKRNLTATVITVNTNAATAAVIFLFFMALFLSVFS